MLKDCVGTACSPKKKTQTSKFNCKLAEGYHPYLISN